jgi:hypothetical protein
VLGSTQKESSEQSNQDWPLSSAGAVRFKFSSGTTCWSPAPYQHVAPVVFSQNYIHHCSFQPKLHPLSPVVFSQNYTTLYFSVKTTSTTVVFSQNYIHCHLYFSVKTTQHRRPSSTEPTPIYRVRGAARPKAEQHRAPGAWQACRAKGTWQQQAL